MRKVIAAVVGEEFHDAVVSFVASSPAYKNKTDFCTKALVDFASRHGINVLYRNTEEMYTDTDTEEKFDRNHTNFS